MPRYPNPKNPSPRPGDDGFTRVGCKAGLFTALFLTLFYALPRLAFASLRASLSGGRPTGGAGDRPGGGSGGSTGPGRPGTSGGVRPSGPGR